MSRRSNMPPIPTISACAAPTPTKRHSSRSGTMAGITLGGIAITSSISAGSDPGSGLSPSATSSMSRCGHGTTGTTIHSGPTAMAISIRPFSSPTAMRITCRDRERPSAWRGSSRASSRAAMKKPAKSPTGRLDQMHDRVASLVDGVNTVSPALSGFYDSLSDEQKARFDHIAPHASRRGPPPQRDLTTLNVQAQCDAGMMAWPTDQIDRVVRPDEAQRSKLQALQSAAAQAADTIKAACPTEMPNTPPARIAAVGRRLQAILTGVETMRPALAAFYNSLSDDHKARFNSMGRQLFAQSAGTSSE